jgi:hypothetical protein
MCFVIWILSAWKKSENAIFQKTTEVFLSGSSFFFCTFKAATDTYFDILNLGIVQKEVSVFWLSPSMLLITVTKNKKY